MSAPENPAWFARCWRHSPHHPHTWTPDPNGRWYACDGMSWATDSEPQGVPLAELVSEYFEDYLRGDGSLTLSTMQVNSVRALLGLVHVDDLAQSWLDALPEQLKEDPES